jgi:hypothetical protein
MPNLSIPLKSLRLKVIIYGSLASHTEEGIHHGGTETRRRDGVNVRVFPGKEHTNISAIGVWSEAGVCGVRGKSEKASLLDLQTEV